MVEITFTASQDYRDAFHEVTLDVLFETPQGRTLKVPAFWAGGRVWKVRYASPAVGTHRWRSVCSVPADRGLHGLTGTVTVEPYRGENPLYLHGPMRVAADRRHFEHLDGTPFFWLGDTWWMGLCQRLHWPRRVPATGRRPQGQGLQRGPDRGRAVPRHAGLRSARGQRGGLPLGKGLRPHPARVFRQGRPAAPVPGRSGLRAVHRRRLGLPSSLAGRRADEGALALPDRPLRRAARGLVRGGRRHDAVLRLQAGQRRGGIPETRLDRGDPIHPGHRPLRPDDHHPSLAVRPGNGHRPCHPRFRHAPDRPPAGRRDRQHGPADAARPTRRSPPCR